MQEQDIIDSKQISQKLFGFFLLYWIFLSILYSMIYSVIRASLSESLIISAIIGIVLQAILITLSWKCATTSAFKKKTIHGTEVPSMMKMLIVFTIIIWGVGAFISLSEVNATIDKAVESNISLKFSELWMKQLYNDEQMQQYQLEKEKAISEVKSKLYTYLAILQIGLLGVHLGVLPLEKRFILKYTIY